MENQEQPNPSSQEPSEQPLNQQPQKKSRFLKPLNNLSVKQMLVFALIFGAVGSYIIFRTFAASTPPDQANQVTLEGTLQVKTGEQFKVDPKTNLPDPTTVVEVNEYTLKAADGKSYHLQYPDDLKQHVKNDGPELLSGSKVRVTGKPSAQDSKTIQLAAYGGGTTGSSTTISSATAAAVNGALKVAVVLINYTSDTRQQYTVDQARQLVFTNPDSTAAFIQENSYGKASLTGIQRPDGDVFGYYTEDCNNETATNATSQMAAQGIDIYAYDHVIWYVTGGGCNHSIAGFAEEPGRNVYVSGIYNSLVAHELGHNLGLSHSNGIQCQDNYDLFSTNTNYNSNTYGSCQQGTLGVEYADPFDVMGAVNAPGEYEGFDKYNLGWLTNVPTVSSSGTYTIDPLESPSSGYQLLRIQFGTTKTRQYRYLEFRQQVGFDKGYSSNDLNGVFVASNYGNNPLLIDAVTYTPGLVVQLGKTYTEPSNGFSFTVTSVSSAGATVNINFGKATTAAKTVTTAAAVRGGGGKTSSGTTGDNASCVSINAPKSAAYSSTFLVTLTMKNTGTTTWTPANYDIGRLAYYENTYTDDLGWFSLDGTRNPDNPLLLRLSLPGNVAPGAVVSVSATMPAGSGTHSLSYRLMKESTNTWFGNPCYGSINFTYGTDTTPPDAPTNLAPASLGSNAPYNSAYMTWTAPHDNVDTTLNYKIFRKGPHDTAFVPWNLEYYFPEYDDLVTSGATYSYYVTAVDSSGNESAPSNTITYTAP